MFATENQKLFLFSPSIRDDYSQRTIVIVPQQQDAITIVYLFVKAPIRQTSI